MEEEKLRILLIGSGGREHALAWKLSQSPLVDSIRVVPGNGGTATGISKVQNISNVDPNDFRSLLAFAKEHSVNLVVPGPEVPLVAGIESIFRAGGIRCFGPTKKAARMEGSKTFAKDFMTRHNIPTARYKNFGDYEKAKEHLDKVPYKVVIKATGLAAGKGVILPSSVEEAQAALKGIMLNKEFGSAGDEVVIEEYLEGQELSFLSFSDGSSVQTLAPGQDHKNIYDSDSGPNTGGMGCYAPSPIATPELIEEVHRTILQPTIDGMRKERMPFQGLLFTGLMITKDGPRTLEYNVRFGDPETQTMLPLMDGDLADVMLACTEGCLDAVSVKTHSGYAATVVASAGGYPGPYVRGDGINFDGPPADTQIFHAGTALPPAPKAQSHAQAPTLITSGGRVIAATSIAKSLKAAIDKAYDGMSTIHFPNMHYRTDIGKKGLEALDAQAAQRKANLTNGESLTYASAGVSIAAGDEFVHRIKPLVRSTARPGAFPELGGFGGSFSQADAGYTSPPMLVSGTDGVGTKLEIARAVKKYDTIGRDLVAMNVNDLVVQGAEPLIFLDTLTFAKLNVDVAVKIVEGICAGCREAECALVGGETAEHPDSFPDSEGFDVQGSSTGAIAQGRPILPIKSAMKAGDALLGLASDGCHSNGFTLIRKIIRRAGLSYHDDAPWAKGESVGESLLTPTRIYVKPVLKVYNKDLVKGMAHITGGGLIDNVPRMLPEHLAAEMDVTAWHFQKVFRWLKEQGHVENEEFATTFNCGLGFVLVVGPEEVEKTLNELRRAGETVHVVGKLTERDGKGCVLRHMETWQ